MSKKEEMKNMRDNTAKHRDNLSLLFSMPEYAERVDSIRREFEIPAVMYDPDTAGGSAKTFDEWVLRLEERAADVWIRVNEIIRDFNLPEHYSKAIHHNIFSGGTRWVPSEPFNVFGFDPRSPQRTVTVKIFEKLTDKDLADLKRHVNKYFGKDLVPNFKPMKGLETKMAIEKYHKNRIAHDYVEDVSYKLSANEIAENVKEETGKKVKEGEVYDAPRQLEKLRSKRFRKSGTK